MFPFNAASSIHISFMGSMSSPSFARRFVNWRESVLPIMWYSDFTVVCLSLMRFISNPILPELDGVKPPAPLTLHYNWVILYFHIA